MVQPQEIIDAIVSELENSAEITSEANFLGFEPDIDSNPVKLPLVQVSSETKVNVDENNSNFIEFTTDQDGNNTGRRFQTLYTQEFEVASWTAQGSKFESHEVGDAVRRALLPLTTSGPEKPLVNPETGEELDDVWNVRLLETQRTDDLGTSPTLRQRTEIVEVSASEQYVIEADEPAATGFNFNNDVL